MIRELGEELDGRDKNLNLSNIISLTGDTFISKIGDSYSYKGIPCE